MVLNTTIDHYKAENAALRKVVEAARLIFSKRVGAFGTCLADRGATEFALDVEALRPLLAALDEAKGGGA